VDSVTLFVVICVFLLVFAATLLSQTAKTALKSSTKGQSPKHNLARIITTLSILCYVILVYLHVLPTTDSSTEHYRLSIGGALALIGLVYVLYALYCQRQQNLHGLSAILFAASAVCCIGLLSTDTSFVIKQSGWIFYLHLFLSLCAYALLSIAALLTVIEPWQSKRLRADPGNAGTFFPPLDTLDTETFRLISLGFVLLSVALLSGFFFLEDLRAQHLPHKVILSLLAWLVFAILLLGRWRLGWRGKTAMRLALAGFFLLALAYFGSKWVLEVLLQRSWN